MLAEREEEASKNIGVDQYNYNPEHLEAGRKTREDARVWSRIGSETGFGKEKVKIEEAEKEKSRSLSAN